MEAEHEEYVRRPLSWDQPMKRPVSYMHIPIIPEHGQADYDMLRSLKLDAATKLYLGLINLADGLEGAKRRIAMARSAVPDFGIAMFCGLGRAPSAPGPAGPPAQAADPRCAARRPRRSDRCSTYTGKQPRSRTHE